MRDARADAFALNDIAPLNTVAVEVDAAPEARVIPLAPGLPDDWFEHDGQITKRDIRAVTLSALAPRKGELLWDVGAGSGSIAIEWMLSDPANRAIAIERDAARAARIARNALSLGVPDLRDRRGRSAAGARRTRRAARDLHRRRRRCGDARRRVGRAAPLRTHRRQRRYDRDAGAARRRLSQTRAASSYICRSRMRGPIGRFHALDPAMAGAAMARR